MQSFERESLCFDPIHGYISFRKEPTGRAGEATERDIIDHPWVQRMRSIHQLQTAWWVYPSAEHSRFQHILGVMHMASQAVDHLYDSLKAVCPDCPSRGYVESLMRMTGLLHDVGHGPFGHFFDAHFLSDYQLNHEILGGHIIRNELGDTLRRLRANPFSQLEEDETLDPDQIAWLIARPQANDPEPRPKWLVLLRSLLSGIYTIDNMDFVLRDAYMTGFSQQSFDLPRLLHYTFFGDQGLTIHDRGLGALLRFLAMRSDLFATIYFHREIRAIDLTLADLFREGKQFLFPGNPLDHLDAYQQFTEFSLLTDVRRWTTADNQQQRELGERWRQLLARQTPWKMACQRSLIFNENDAEQTSVFSSPDLLTTLLAQQLPSDISSADFRVDIARHIHRPHTLGPTAGQNFLYDSSQDRVVPLQASALYKRLPVSQRTCRVYTRDPAHAPAIVSAMKALTSSHGVDDPTNM